MACFQIKQNMLALNRSIIIIHLFQQQILRTSESGSFFNRKSVKTISAKVDAVSANGRQACCSKMFLSFALKE